MSQEAHVRFCEGPQVKSLRSTHPYVWTVQGWLYLAVVMDLYSRRIVGWCMDRTMTQALVIRALMMAINLRRPEAGLIHHSDRGSQYSGEAYQTLLAQHGIIVSMSRKGNCWERAACPWGTMQ